jgi:hypothetical protein
MTRVDLKGQRPDEATETRGMAEQGRREEDVQSHAGASVSNRLFVILVVVMVVVFGGIALAVRM